MDEARRRARARHCRPVHSEGREKKSHAACRPLPLPPPRLSSLPPILLLLHVMDELIYWHMYVIEFLAVCLGRAGRSR